MRGCPLPFSPDRSTLVSVGLSTIGYALWDVAKRNQTFAMKRDQCRFQSRELNAMIAAAGMDAVMKLWVMQDTRGQQ